MAINTTQATTMADAIESMIDGHTHEELSAIRDSLKNYILACDLRHKDTRTAAHRDYDTPKESCFTAARTTLGDLMALSAMADWTGRNPMSEPTAQFQMLTEVIDVGFPASNGFFSAVVIYSMRGYRTAGGPVGFVHWKNETADLTNAPVGTITDVGVLARRVE